MVEERKKGGERKREKCLSQLHPRSMRPSSLQLGLAQLEDQKGAEKDKRKSGGKSRECAVPRPCPAAPRRTSDERKEAREQGREGKREGEKKKELTASAEPAVLQLRRHLFCSPLRSQLADEIGEGGRDGKRKEEKEGRGAA